MNTRDTKPEQDQDKQLSSVAALKSRFAAGNVINNSSQKSGIQEELKELKAIRTNSTQREKPHQPTIEPRIAASTPGLNPELQNVNVSFLSKQLSNKLSFASPVQSNENVQKVLIENEIKELKQEKGHVLKIAKEMANLLENSKKVIEEVKKNTVSEKAKQELKLPHEFKIFEEQQSIMIANLECKLKMDIQEYEELRQSNPINLNQFLELSFIYRSYEVCLEQDLRRHAASIIQKNSTNKQNDIPLMGTSTELAIQSLNYYQDFFQKLSAIEKIWPDAGVKIRKSEIALLYAGRFCQDVNALAGMVNKTDINDAIFESHLTQFIRTNVMMSTYIKSGNGLDTANHPWTLNKAKRLEQANSSINFMQIVPVDKVHAVAIAEVKERVENDNTQLRK